MIEVGPYAPLAVALIATCYDLVLGTPNLRSLLSDQSGAGSTAPDAIEASCCAFIDARSASSSCAVGRPNTPTTASPMNLPTPPPGGLRGHGRAAGAAAEEALGALPGAARARLHANAAYERTVAERLSAMQMS